MSGQPLFSFSIFQTLMEPCAKVATSINLLPLVETVTDKEMGSEAIPFNLDEFNSHVDNVFQYLDPFSKWAPEFDKG